MSTEMGVGILFPNQQYLAILKYCDKEKFSFLYKEEDL